MKCKAIVKAVHENMATTKSLRANSYMNLHVKCFNIQTVHRTINILSRNQALIVHY